MTWFRQNRFLGTFLILFGAALLGVLWFLFSAKGDLAEASARFTNTSTELNRLERLAPYPNVENLRKMKADAENYATALTKLKAELKMRVVPAPPLAPSEFQSHLRIALNAIADKARANKVKLPEKFYLGLDDYASALPIEHAAPLLGQELTELEWLMNTLLDAHVDAVTVFRRAPLPEERTAAGASATPAAVPNRLLERNFLETTFVCTPGAARKVINQVAGASQHFCIIRLLHVRNEKDKGPARENPGETANVPSPSPATKAASAAAVNFIVGNEKIETTATIEIVRFTF